MLLLPSRCGACRRSGPSPCPACRAGLAVAPTPATPPPLAALFALLAYDGAARPLVAGLKVRHNRAAQQWLADGLALLLPSDVELVTWAPTSTARAAARGFDHARLLAEAVGRAAGVRSHRTLSRLPGPPQTGRARSERMAAGPSFTPSYDLSGLAVAIVDDVTTTGATLAAAGRAVVAAGARSAVGLAAAATPVPGRGERPGAREGPPRSSLRSDEAAAQPTRSLNQSGRGPLGRSA